MRQQAAVLRHVADCGGAARPAASPRRRSPPTSTVPAVGHDHAVEAAQQRRLAGAALADERDAAPLLDAQAHAVHGDDRPEDAAYRTRLERRGCFGGFRQRVLALAAASFRAHRRARASARRATRYDRGRRLGDRRAVEGGSGRSATRRRRPEWEAPRTGREGADRLSFDDVRTATVPGLPNRVVATAGVPDAFAPTWSRRTRDQRASR